MDLLGNGGWMFWRHGRGGIHLQYMDGWSLWKGQNHSKYQKCHECLVIFCIKLTKKNDTLKLIDTFSYFFGVFSECTNYLVIVPHWSTIPYDLGMVRLDAKSSKSQGWSIFPSLPASKVSLAAAGAQRCAPMNWRRVDGCLMSLRDFFSALKLLCNFASRSCQSVKLPTTAWLKLLRKETFVTHSLRFSKNRLSRTLFRIARSGYGIILYLYNPRPRPLYFKHIINTRCIWICNTIPAPSEGCQMDGKGCH